MPAKSLHSPIPWKLSRDMRRGVIEIHSSRNPVPIATSVGCIGGAEGDDNFSHMVACVNGADARTMALRAALQIAYGYLSMEETCSEGTNEGVTMDAEKVRAALKL